MDFLTKLPKDLIDHILYFLPAKEGARTSVLSKSWKSVWDSRSRVDLDQHLIRPGDKFLGFMWKTLESYIRQGLRVEKLTISTASAEADNLDPQTLSSSMKEWINFVFAPGNNLKELKISAYNLKKSYFPLNLRASNTLTTLNLCNCTFENIISSENIKFPSLQNLSLKDTQLNSDIIHKTFLSGSPFLKSLSLIACDRLECLQISGLVKITSVSIRSCGSLRRVDITAPNLRDFSFSGMLVLGTPYNYEIKLAACEKSLKQLKLHKIKLSNKIWLQTMVSRFVSLQLLDLFGVYPAPNKKILKISSPSIRKLVMRSCTSFNDNTVINAPNLQSVKFIDNKHPLYSLPASNNLSQVQFCFHIEKERNIPLLLSKLKELLARNNHIKDMSMTLLCRQLQNQNCLILHEDFSDLLLNNIIRNIEYMNQKLEVTISSSSRCEDWVDCLFKGQISPNWEAIYIASSSSSHNANFVKEFYKSLSRWKRTVKYCPHGRMQCWKHALKKIPIDQNLNCEEVINKGGHTNAALLQSYQGYLSYKLTRFDLQYYTKRC